MATAGNLSCALLTLQSKAELHSKTLCTVSHSGFIHFVMTQKKTAIISLSSINRLFFCNGHCHCIPAVRTEFLYISKNSIRLLRPASHREGPGLIAYHSMLISCGQSGTGTILRFPQSVSFHRWSIFIFIYTLLLPEGQTGEAWEHSRKQCSFGNRGAVDIKLLLLSPQASKATFVALCLGVRHNTQPHCIYCYVYMKRCTIDVGKLIRLANAFICSGLSIAQGLI